MAGSKDPAILLWRESPRFRMGLLAKAEVSILRLRASNVELRMEVASEFQSKILTRKRAPEEYRIYRASLEWDLTDPIVIERAEDFKSTYRWRDRLTPYRHQVSNLITFCRRLPVTLLADDVGLGKTIGVTAGLETSEQALAQPDPS